MKRCALTIAAGPKYCPSFQNTGHELVHAAHRMHLVVSSKRARSASDCRRSRVGSLPVVTRNGMTSRYAWKNGSMSTTRSLRTVRPLMASTVIGLVPTPSLTAVMSLISVLHASRLRPLMRIASEPQMPCAQERRKVSVPSSSHLILWSASRTRSLGSISKVKSSHTASADTSGLKRRIRKVAVIRCGTAESLDASAPESPDFSMTAVLISTYAPSAGSGSARPACSPAGSTRCRRRPPRGTPSCDA